MSGLAIAAGTTAVIGGAEFVEGLESKKKETRELKSLHQPFYNIQSEVFQNRNLAAQQAGQGTPTAVKQQEVQGAQQGLGAGLNDILKTGGDVNLVSLLLSQYNNNMGKIGAEDAEEHRRNLEGFMKSNADLAGEKTKQWSINELQPYEAKLKELKQNIQTDQQNEMSGLTTAVGGLTSLGTGNSNSALIKKLMTQLQGQGGASGASFAPVGIANTGGAAPSPAAGVGTINPGSAPNLGLPSNTNYTDSNS